MKNIKERDRVTCLFTCALSVMQAGGSKYELHGASLLVLCWSIWPEFSWEIFLGNSWHRIFQSKYWISKDLHSALLCLCWLREEQRGESYILQFWPLPERWPEDYKLLEKKYKIKNSHFGAIPRLCSLVFCVFCVSLFCVCFFFKFFQMLLFSALHFSYEILLTLKAVKMTTFKVRECWKLSFSPFKVTQAL